jgi:hypothetical protein
MECLAKACAGKHPHRFPRRPKAAGDEVTAENGGGAGVRLKENLKQEFEVSILI